MSRLKADHVAVARLAAGEWNHDRDGRPHVDDITAALQLLVDREVPVQEIARRLGVHERQVYRWQDDLAAGRELLPGRVGRPPRRAA